MVVVERRERLAIVRLTRPPANAVNLELARELFERLSELLEDDSVAGVVVTGTGGFFSAGLDLKQVPLYAPEQQHSLISTINRTLFLTYGAPKPIVGAINGHCMAGALVMALGCDYRVGADDASKFGLTEVRAGVPYPEAARALVAAELGPQALRVLTLRGQHFSAKQALDFGVLDELVEPSQVLPRALEAAHELAALPRSGYSHIKRQFRAPALAQMERAANGADPLFDGWLSAETPEASSRVLGKEGREAQKP